jgi:hypothetical protein
MPCSTAAIDSITSDHVRCGEFSYSEGTVSAYHQSPGLETISFRCSDQILSFSGILTARPCCCDERTSRQTFRTSRPRYDTHALFPRLLDDPTPSCPPDLLDSIRAVRPADYRDSAESQIITLFDMSEEPNLPPADIHEYLGGDMIRCFLQCDSSDHVSSGIRRAHDCL